MLAIALASYGPDLLEIALMFPKPREGMGIYTHSIPAMLVSASLAAVLCRPFIGTGGGKVIFYSWMLHLPADLFTGRKPLISMRWLTGLDLYHVQWADAAIESALILFACAAYAKAFAHDRRARRWTVALAMALVGLQLLADAVFWRINRPEWIPSLTSREAGADLRAEARIARIPPHASCI